MTRVLSNGFSLIELMIVIAIIGILAAIAVPLYLDYATRARVSEGLGFAAEAKTRVAAFRFSTGNWPLTEGQAGIDSSAYQTENVQDLSLNIATGTAADPEPSIAVMFTSKVAAGASIILQAHQTNTGGAIDWTCTHSLPSNSQVPAECR